MAAFLIYISLSFLIGKIGENRRLGFWGYVIASLIFTPLGGILLLFPSEPNEPSEPDES